MRHYVSLILQIVAFMALVVAAVVIYISAPVMSP